MLALDGPPVPLPMWTRWELNSPPLLFPLQETTMNSKVRSMSISGSLFACLVLFRALLVLYINPKFHSKLCYHMLIVNYILV